MPQRAPGPLPLHLRQMEKHYWFEYLLDAEVLYVHFCARLFRFAAEHPFAKSILDLRWNNGGNTFLVQPLIHGLIRSDKINKRATLFVIICRKTFLPHKTRPA